MIRFILPLLIIISMVPATGASSTAGAVPAAVFGRLPSIRSINISPDGETLVMLRARRDTYHVVVTDLKTRKSRMVMAANPDDFLFDWCRFANNSRVVCQIRQYMVLQAGAGSGIGYYYDGRTIFTRLMAANTDRTNVLQLVPKAKATSVGQKLQWNAINESTVINWLPDEPDYILVQLAREDRTLPSVYRLNINTNKMKRVRKFRTGIARWTANDQGEVVLGTGFNTSGEPIAFSVSSNRFKKIDIRHLLGAEQPSPIAVAEDGKSLWVGANYQSNTRGIHRVSLKDGAVIETLYVNDGFDTDALVIHPETKRPVRITYYSDTLNYHWFDKEAEKQYNELKAALPGHPSWVQIVSANKSRDKLIIRAEGNRTNPAWYLFDATVPTLSMIGKAYADVGPLVDLEYVTYTTRDDIEISAYLALPGSKDAGPYPTIILPHGGPWSRDTDRFDYWVQFFLSRGYAVLKPNFRGSSGFGDRFMVSGFKQWGLKMQEDVMDGLDWMIDQGFTDPERVCVVGGSYGGYVAGVAAYKTPDKFKCVVSFAGVSGLGGLAQRWRAMGQAGTASQRLQSGSSRSQNSPIDNVDRISIPVLLVHGDVDRRVMIEQSRKFSEALEKSGKDYIYIEQENGNHHLSLQSHRIEFFEAMDKFLARHLGKSKNSIAAADSE
ncbi:MAG: alpha/beta fold hydrolase [bacterium]